MLPFEIPLFTASLQFPSFFFAFSTPFFLFSCVLISFVCNIVTRIFIASTSHKLNIYVHWLRCIRCSFAQIPQLCKFTQANFIDRNEQRFLCIPPIIFSSNTIKFIYYLLIIAHTATSQMRFNLWPVFFSSFLLSVNPRTLGKDSVIKRLYNAIWYGLY